MPASLPNSLASTLLSTAKLEAPFHGSLFQRAESKVFQERVLTLLLPLSTQSNPTLSLQPRLHLAFVFHRILGNPKSPPLSKGRDRRG